MYVEEVKIPQSSEGCNLKEGNYVSSCKGLKCVCKISPLWKQNHFSSKGKQQSGAWKRTAFSESHYLHSKHTTSSVWKFPFTALCAQHTARNAHLGSYSHIQPLGIIQRPLFKHVSEALPDDPNIPVKRRVGESPGCQNTAGNRTHA